MTMGRLTSLSAQGGLRGDKLRANNCLNTINKNVCPLSVCFLKSNESHLGLNLETSLKMQFLIENVCLSSKEAYFS